MGSIVHTHYASTSTDIADCVIPVVAIFDGQHSLDNVVAVVDIDLYNNRPQFCANDDQDTYFSRETWSMPTHLTRPALLRWLGVNRLCRQHESYQWVVHYGQRLWVAQDLLPYQIFDGHYIKVSIKVPEVDFPLLFVLEYVRVGIPPEDMNNHWKEQAAISAERLRNLFPTDDEALIDSTAPQEQDQGTDVTSMMATNRPRLPDGTEDPHPQMILVWSRIYVPQRFYVNPPATAAHHRSLIGDLMDIPQNTRAWDNYLTFRVLPAPPEIDIFHQDPYLLVMPAEIIAEYSFILVDLTYEINEENTCTQTTEIEREVHRVPTRTTRITLLRGLKVYELCIISGRDTCEIYCANQHWRAWDPTIHHVYDGTYATVKVPIEYPNIPLAQQKEAMRQGHTAEFLIGQWTTPPVFSMMQHEMRLNSPNDDDVATLMQMGSPCLVHPPYCDFGIAGRRPHDQFVYLHTWLHPWHLRDVFVSNFRQVLHRRIACASCDIARVWQDQTGRRSLKHVFVQDGLQPVPIVSLILLTVDDEDFRAVLIDYHFGETWQKGTLMLQDPNIQIDSSKIFDAVAPFNSCRRTSWCYIGHHTGRVWWPATIPIEEGAALTVVEIPAQASPMTSTHCEGSNADSCTDDELTSDDECLLSHTILGHDEPVSFLQIYYSFHIDPFSGLRPPGNVNLNTLDDVQATEFGQKVIDYVPRPIPTPARSSAKIPIALAAALDPPKNYQPPELPDLHLLIEDLFLIHPQCEMPWQYLHDHIDQDLQTMLKNVNIGRPAEIDAVHIYTDGSYVHETSMAAAWSFIVLAFDDDQIYYLGHGYGTVVVSELGHGWCGAERQGSREAELEAIIHGIEWALQESIASPHKFHFDALNAGYVAQGRWQADTADPQATLLRNLALSLDIFLQAKTPTAWDHVRGHTGVFGNELADAIAKFAFSTQSSCGGFQHIEYLPYLVGPRCSIQWLWFIASGISAPPDLPIAEDGTFSCVQPQKIDAPTDKFPTISVPEVQGEVIHFQLGILTYNVGTLGNGTKATHMWQPVYLRDQLQAHQAHIVCLQETRARESTLIESTTHIRLISAANKGQGGTEIWLLKTTKPDVGAKMLIRAQDITVVHANPELLIAKILYAGLKVIVISAHAPHTGRPAQQINQFWDQLEALLSDGAYTDYCIILGIDANAHFGEEADRYVGPHGLEDHTNLNGQRFLQTLTKFQLYLPSTFDGQHEGHTWTWRHPANGSTARCDYIGVPLLWNQSNVKTWPCHTLDCGHALFDHVPLYLQADISFAKSIRKQRAHRFDREEVWKATPEKLRAVFDNLPTIPWECDLDQHALFAAQQVQERLVQAFPLQKSKPWRQYLSSPTWDLRHQRIRLHRQIRALQDESRQLSVQYYFDLWATQHTLSFDTLAAAGFTLFFKIWKLKQEVHHTAKELRRSLRADRTEYLQTVATTASQMPAHEFFRCMRTIGAAGRAKQRGSRPLPILQHEDGTVLTNHADVAARWRRYFAKQEDGIEISQAELVHMQMQQSCKELVTPRWDQIPTLQELEAQFRRAAPLKAMFLDGTPGELLHKIPEAMAKYYYPLLLKMVTQQCEPMLFKGGTLVPAYKRKGSMAHCESYRSLMLSSIIGKSIHAMYRRELMTNLQGYALPLQLGGMQGQSVTHASQALLAYHYYMKKRGMSVAFLFVDIQQAFYRLLRQYLVQIDDHRGIEELFKGLDLPGEAFEEFVAHFHQKTALQESGISAHLQAMISAFMSCTWSHVPNDDRLLHMRRGSRPGDALADIAFTFAMAKILRGCITEIEDEAIPTLYWSGIHEPQPTRTQDCMLPVLCPIWTDDFAIALASSTPSNLVTLTQKVTGRILDAFASAGMTPNMSQRKTEVLLDLRGKGTDCQKRELQYRDMLLETDSTLVKEPVHVVGACKHLGTWIANRASLLLDLRTKFGIAHRTLTKYRAPVFANRALQFNKKIQLYRQLVCTSFQCSWLARSECERNESIHHRSTSTTSKSCTDALWAGSFPLEQSASACSVPTRNP